MSLMRLSALFCILFFCAWLTLPASGETILYVSPTLGKPFTNCTTCAPCDTIGRAFEIGGSLTDLHLRLLPGSYVLLDQGLARPMTFQTLEISGISTLPDCLISPVEPSSDNIVIAGLWNMSSYDSLSRVSLSGVTWKPSHTQTSGSVLLVLNKFAVFAISNVNIHCRGGCKILAYFDESVPCGLSFDHVFVDSDRFVLDVRPSNSDYPSLKRHDISIYFHEATLPIFELIGKNFSAVFSQSSFGQKFSLAPYGPINARIEHSLFVGTEAFLDSWHMGTWTANIMNCTFLPDWEDKCPPQIRFNNRVNALLRYNYFFSDPSLYEHQVFTVEEPFWVDARANYWGDPSGPYSCCSPSSRGALAFGGDTSSWCLDVQCSQLSEPLNSSVYYDGSLNYTTRACERVRVCEEWAIPLVIVVGCALAIVSLVSLVGRITVCILDRRSHSKPTYEEVSADASLERVISPLKGDGHENRYTAVSDVVIVLATLCISVAAFAPSFLFRGIYQENIPNNIALIVALGLRIGTSTWHLIIMLASGHPNYHSLLANVIVSTGVILLALSWRFTGFFNLMSTKNNWPTDAPSGKMQHDYFLAIWFAHVLVEMFICLPRLIRDFKLLKTRDYAVDALSKTVKHAAVGSKLPGLLAASSLGPTARGISWLSLALGVAMVIFYIVNQFLSDAAAWRWQSVLFLVSALVSLLGFFFLRWRFYLLAPGYAYFAASAGITFLMLDSGVQAVYVGISSRDLISAIRGGCIFLFVIVSIVRGVFLVKLLRALRSTLARDLETSVYRQLEDALEN